VPGGVRAGSEPGGQGHAQGPAFVFRAASGSLLIVLRPSGEGGGPPAGLTGAAGTTAETGWSAAFVTGGPPVGGGAGSTAGYVLPDANVLPFAESNLLEQYFQAPQAGRAG